MKAELIKINAELSIAEQKICDKLIKENPNICLKELNKKIDKAMLPINKKALQSLASASTNFRDSLI